VDKNGSGSCRIVEFYSNGVEPWTSVTRDVMYISVRLFLSNLLIS
jgi:hypothetical protein